MTAEPDTERPRIDVAEVLDDLQAVVAEKGDGFVYLRGADPVKCEYAENGQPSCIVGHVLARHDLLDIDTARNNEALNVYGTYVAAEWDDYDAPTSMLPHFTPAAIRALAAAQSVQDESDRTWGEALIAAKEVAAEVAP